ncbi:MAG: AsmA-like C-terminal domain-containing protein [Candidatus Puniceispirillaceae bacterium]
MTTNTPQSPDKQTKADELSKMSETIPQTVSGKKGDRFYRVALRALLALGAFLVIAIFGVWLVIYQSGGLIKFLESRLTFPEQRLETRIQEAHLSFFDDGLNAAIHMADVEVSYGAQKLQLPHVSFDVSASRLITGQFARVALSSLMLDLVWDQNSLSVQDVTSGKPAHWFDMKGGFALKEGQAGDQFTQLAFLSVFADRHLVLRDSTIRLRDPQNDKMLVFEDVALSAFSSDDTTLMVNGSARQSDNEKGRLTFHLATNLQSGFSEIDLKTQSLSLEPLGPFLPKDMRPLGNLGFADADLAMQFDGATLQTATGDMSLVNGQLPDGTAISNLSFGARYSRPDDYLVLPEVKLQLADGQQLTFDGEIIGISLPKSGFRGTLVLDDIPIESLLSQWPETALPDVRSYMISSLSGGDFQSLALRLKGQYDKVVQALSLSELRLQGDVQDVRLQTGFGQYRQLVGTAKGQMILEVMSAGRLRQAEMAIQIDDGYLITELGAAPLHFETASGLISYRPGELQASDMMVKFTEDGDIDADLVMSVAPDRTLDSTQLTLSSQMLTPKAFIELFPQNLAPEAISFIDDRLKNGVLRNTRLTLETQKAADNNSGQIVSHLQASADFDDADFSYLTGEAPLQDLSGQIALADNQLSIFIDEGTSPAVSLNDSHVDITPLFGSENEVRQVALSLNARADLANVIPLLNTPQINALDDLPISLAQASGDAQAHLLLSATLAPQEAFRLKLDLLEGTLSKVAARDIYDDFDLTDGDLVLNYQDGHLELTGIASLDNMTSEFALTHHLGALTLSGYVAPQPSVMQKIAPLLGQDMTGALGARFVAETDDGGENIKLVVEADLSRAAISMPMLNWEKPTGKQASLAGTLFLRQGRLHRANALHLKAQDLSATADFEMTDTGKFSAAYLHDVSWPGNQLDEVFIERKADDSLSIIAEGEMLDLRNLRSTSDNATTGMALSFDITSPNLLIDDTISLFGQMTGTLTASGDGRATLQGALLHEGRPLIEEGTVTALFGPSGEHLDAVGLIGGAEARLDYSPDEEQGGILIINTNNAGRVLAGLGITDTIRSGRMVLVNSYKGDDFSTYDTTINLEEFNVIEAPAAVRAFSVLGLAGLYSLVEGDGTRFTRGEVEIQTTGNEHIITRLQASGGAVGVTMVGKYNSKTRQVDISGNLVPVKQFSKIVGSVPFLGGLLAGIDNAGIFATQFNVKGAIDDPETSVNAASFVPGVLRDLFSPDWLNRESERITQDNQTAR